MSRPGFDIEALSGILGSISIACWVCVFSPQIIENFRRQSAEGLSIVFIVVWLLGDLFNILGGVLQGILPTMIILAVYYTVADVVLLAQVFYYRGFTLSDAPPQLKEQREHEILNGTEQEGGNEETPLLTPANASARTASPSSGLSGTGRRGSSGAASFVEHITSNGQHLNPAVPLIDESRIRSESAPAENSTASQFWGALFNFAALVVVCLAGALGWWISTAASRKPYTRNDVGDYYGHEVRDDADELGFDVWGQIFGYFCAVLYLGSRIPQLMLNYRRKSTEGVSMLFFLFACVGNLTYVLSIFAYEPPCARWNTSLDSTTGEPVGYSQSCVNDEWSEQYGRYIGVNASWLIGSAGTLLLDMAIFVQFWMYRGRSPSEGTIRIGTPDQDLSRN